MKIKKAIGVIVAVLMIFSTLTVLSGCGEKNPSLVFASSGEKIAEITSTISGEASYTNKNYSAYIDFVIEDAAVALAKTMDILTDEASELLCEEGYKIFTTFSKEDMDCLINAHTQSKLEKSTLFGAAVTDLKGAVTAAYSSGARQGLSNFALSKSQPYSSIKPLSVYAPALEKGIINYATGIEDSPFKQITDAGGNKSDWPTNASGRYSNKNISIGDAIRDSVNTVSVRTLDMLGAGNSLDFLKNSFSLDLTEERKKRAEYGNEEIYGNLAMGYLIKGVSPLDMAGYYSIFANGGKYTKPYAVTKITDLSGEVIYTVKPEEKQVISADTAYIMNRMLNSVVTQGGTGKAARLGGIDICGKTGTGSANGLSGNWFAGITPGFSCTVWHGGGDEANIAPDIFKAFTKNKTDGKNNSALRRFSGTKNVKMRMFCANSGCLATSECGLVSEGYFTEDNMPEMCSGHSR